MSTKKISNYREGYVPKEKESKIEKGYVPKSPKDGYTPKSSGTKPNDVPKVKPGTKL